MPEPAVRCLSSELVTRFGCFLGLGMSMSKVQPGKTCNKPSQPEGQGSIYLIQGRPRPEKLVIAIVRANGVLKQADCVPHCRRAFCPKILGARSYRTAQPVLDIIPVARATAPSPTSPLLSSPTLTTSRPPPISVASVRSAQRPHSKQHVVRADH